MFNKTALDIWKEEVSNPSILTLCKSLDRALGNGIQVGVLTEIAGLAGSGKTQLCYQLSVNVQFPKIVGGLEGKVLYVDTNQGFNPFRLRDIVNLNSKIFHNVFVKVYNHSEDDKLNAEKILNNIFYMYCKNYTSLISSIELVKEIIKNNKEIKLIIIDSFSFLFRSFDHITERTRILYELLTDLQILAEHFQLAVVLTNELTTRILPGQTNQFSIFTALGDSVGHKIGQRIVFSKRNETHGPKNALNHIAFLEKCFNSPRRYINFQISEIGIRGCQQ